MDACRLFLQCVDSRQVYVCVFERERESEKRSHSLLVASECCYLSACATFDSKANPAPTECVVMVTLAIGISFKSPVSAILILCLLHQHVAASLCVTMLLAWNLFSFGRDVWLMCVFLFIGPLFHLQILIGC